MKPARLLIVGLSLTIVLMAMLENLRAEQPGQTKVVAIDNFNLEQIEIVQIASDRHRTETCESKNSFKQKQGLKRISERNFEQEELMLTLIGICSQINSLYPFIPSFFHLEFPLKKPDGKFKKVRWRINNFPDLERINFLLKQLKISNLEIRVSTRYISLPDPDNPEEMKTSEYFCETCEVLGFTLIQ